MAPLAMLAGLMLPGQEAVPPPTTLPEVVAVAPANEGAVVLECGVNSDGRLRDCVIISETPSGQGFGEAALESAGRARLNRRMVEQSAPGAKVRFTTRFRRDDSGRPLT